MRRIITTSVIAMLLGACSAAAAPTSTPLPTATMSPTAVPSNTPTFTPSATMTATEALPTVVPSATPLLVDPLLDVAVSPPIEIELPPGWGFAYDTLIFRDVDLQSTTAPFAFYSGPVTDGTGTIVLVWGFDSVTTGLQFDSEFGQRNIWLDALRILRLLIFDARCNIGTAPQREYSVGGLPATGNTINVVDCPGDQPDTRGWIAALVVDDINFAFYIYIDPIPPAGHPAEAELQAILDSVVFRVSELSISAEALDATREALAATLTPTGQ